MFDSRKPQDGLAGLHAEIAEEKAGALGRIAEKLEALLAACQRLRGEAEAADTTPVARARILAEYERTRAEAELYYWYLVVQRESVGLYEHGLIARLYPMPPRLPS
jgi:hypothetical protein